MSDHSLQNLRASLYEKASPEKALAAARFFKTGKGEYAEGDIFIGVTVPEIRSLAKAFPDTSLTSIRDLIKSSVHEERLLALILIVEQFKKSSDKKLVDFYLKNRRGVNNWDLVDVSARDLLGNYCLLNGTSEMDKLITSKRQWDRRMAMVATLAFIKKNKIGIVFRYAKLLLTDKEDLMHKATGWMLREAGNKDPEALLVFIEKHASAMPRTMLRYAIEKFPKPQRLEILNRSRS